MEVLGPADRVSIDPSAAIEPFVYRRYLDYAMVEDIKLMKQKIDRSLTRAGVMPSASPA